ncbi:MAG: serine/threonine protein kinase, partial [Planctomycetes bacterium]|nr:serine/threonine protein kinase [Planctomycetota bacterium]
MSDCPSITQLKQLIDDMLPPCEFEDVETHLETCVDCAATLDALTANGAFSWLTATTDLSPSSADAPRPARPFSCALPGYEVLEELGRGGHGVVYRARQLGLNRPVAIKVLRKGSFATPQELSRFLAEAESVARLSHPQIVQVFAVGEYEGLPFFAMELLEGGSLAERCQGVPVASRSAARLIERLARGVDHAHRHNVIHRDLKPGNILFDRAPGGAEQPHESPRFSDDDLPKIADFGLAKQLDGDPAPTPTVAILGTPSYMAPEQALGGTKAAGPAADIYALGAVLYELLTGRPPFRGETPFETLMQVRDHEPVGPRQLQPRLAVDLETICLKCLRKRPLERYASAAELADDLGRFLRGEAVRARPPGPIERLVKWSRRNPVKSSLSGFGLVALFAALAATAWVVEKVHE